ncbi:MAG: TonB-dependent receptor, partial [Ignavibacteriae bacterium]|nr:TonB-dependent receptor [Ignavibacteriota bacterium]
AFMNFIFRKGPFGEFYGDVKIQDVTGSNSKDLPYNSPIIANLNYAYSWTDFKLGFNLNYLSKTFTDRENTNEIPRAFNLGMNLAYEIFQNFDLTLAVQNMFNDKYYYFRNYKAKPVDVIAGFEFRW